jgi:hypothetical protein
MKKGWNKIGEVVRPQKSLVIVDGKGNIMAFKLKPKSSAVKKPVKKVSAKEKQRKATRKPSRKRRLK